MGNAYLSILRRRSVRTSDRSNALSIYLDWNSSSHIHEFPSVTTVQAKSCSTRPHHILVGARRIPVAGCSERFRLRDVDGRQLRAGHAREVQQVERCIYDGNVHGHVDLLGFALACCRSHLGGCKGEVRRAMECLRRRGRFGRHDSALRSDDRELVAGECTKSCKSETREHSPCVPLRCDMLEST